MPFNYATGQYEPDPQDGANPLPSWANNAGYGINQISSDDMMRMQMQAALRANQGLNTAQQTGGAQPGDPAYNNPNYDAQRQAQLGNPNPAGGADRGLNTPTPPTAPAQNYGTFSGNTGTDPNRPPDNSGDWFWSGTAGHWVDKTGQRDATGRYLTDAEKNYWQGYDQSRVSAYNSGTPALFQNYLRNDKNPGLPAGAPPSYVPYTQQPTATSPGQTAATPGTPAQAQAQVVNPDGTDPVWDYSKPYSVNWQAFLKNVYADTNGQPQWQELRDANGQGLTPQQVQAATEQYGWQGVPNSANADPNVTYRQALTLGKQNPGTDYSVVRMNVNGQLVYGVMAREQSQQAQEARGFYAPGSTNPNAPANLARARAQAQAATSRYTKPPVVTGPTVTGPTGPTYTAQQLKDAEARLGASETAAYNARVNQYYTGPGAFTGASATANAGTSGTPTPPTLPQGYNATPRPGTLSPDGSAIWDGTKWVKRGSSSDSGTTSGDTGSTPGMGGGVSNIGGGAYGPNWSTR